MCSNCLLWSYIYNKTRGAQLEAPRLVTLCCISFSFSVFSTLQYKFTVTAMSLVGSVINGGDPFFQMMILDGMWKYKSLPTFLHLATFPLPINVKFRLGGYDGQYQSQSAAEDLLLMKTRVYNQPLLIVFFFFSYDLVRKLKNKKYFHSFKSVHSAMKSHTSTYESFIIFFLSSSSIMCFLYFKLLTFTSVERAAGRHN